MKPNVLAPHLLIYLGLNFCFYGERVQCHRLVDFGIQTQRERSTASSLQDNLRVTTVPLRDYGLLRQGDFGIDSQSGSSIKRSDLSRKEAQLKEYGVVPSRPQDSGHPPAISGIVPEAAFRLVDFSVRRNRPQSLLDNGVQKQAGVTGLPVICYTDTALLDYGHRNQPKRKWKRAGGGSLVHQGGRRHGIEIKTLNFDFQFLVPATLGTTDRGAVGRNVGGLDFGHVTPGRCRELSTPGQREPNSGYRSELPLNGLISPADRRNESQAHDPEFPGDQPTRLQQGPAVETTNYSTEQSGRNGTEYGSLSNPAPESDGGPTQLAQDMLTPNLTGPRNESQGSDPLAGNPTLFQKLFIPQVWEAVQLLSVNLPPQQGAITKGTSVAMHLPGGAPTLCDSSFSKCSPAEKRCKSITNCASDETCCRDHKCGDVCRKIV